MREKKGPLSLRLSPELYARLEEAAKKANTKKHTLAQQAIEAAVKAIEEAGGYLVIPIEFEVARVPKKKSELNQPKREDKPGGNPNTVKNERAP